MLPFLVGVTLMDGEKDWRPMLWTIVLSQGYVGLEQNINYLVKGYNTAAEGFGGMDNNCFAVSLRHCRRTGHCLDDLEQDVGRTPAGGSRRGADPAHHVPDVLSGRNGRAPRRRTCRRS